jgi:hypothetical protein
VKFRAQIAIAAILGLGVYFAPLLAQQQPAAKQAPANAIARAAAAPAKAKVDWTSTTTKKFAAQIGKWVHFQHRSTLRLLAGQPKFSIKGKALPPVTLPVDWTGKGAMPAPMDGNDQLGDCMYAMALHTDNAWTYGNGKSGWTESTFDAQMIVQDYEQLSGGDNGLDEGMLLGSTSTAGSWMAGLCGDPKAIVVAYADVDPTDTATLQFAIDRGFFVQFMWSVPDDFITNYQGNGQIFDQPGNPDPANGHGTPFLGLDGSGRYALYTWGSYCMVSQAFVNSVQPSAFVVFSPRQFGADGYDAKGVHIVTRAADWQTATGTAIPASIINAFPPPSGPNSITLSPATLTAGTIGSPYSVTIAASGGTAPYTFATTGTLNPGLSFSAGTISGTPTTAGIANFTVTATDAKGATGSQAYSLTVGITPPVSGAFLVDLTLSDPNGVAPLFKIKGSVTPPAGFNPTPAAGFNIAVILDIVQLMNDLRSKAPAAIITADLAQLAKDLGISVEELVKALQAKGVSLTQVENTPPGDFTVQQVIGACSDAAGRPQRRVVVYRSR